MRTLSRQYLLATIIILAISILVGFILANAVYMLFTKDIVTEQNHDVVGQIVRVLEDAHVSKDTVHPFLETVGKLGYQLYMTDGAEEHYFYGLPFERSHLPEHVIRQVLDGNPYMGREETWARYWMMGHFSNDIRNSIGLPAQIAGDTYAIFVKSDSKVLFSEFHMILAGFIVAIALVSLLGVIIMTKRVIQPISQLSEATKAIINGDYTYTLNIHRKDELGQLAEHFMLMQQQLEHNEIVRKSFINNVSHDFQSPLMNIRGYADLLLSPSLSEVNRLQYAAIVSDEAKRLSNLTKQLLLITSLEQTGYPVKKSTYLLNQQIRESIRKHQWSLQERGLTISYRLEEVTVNSDRELLALVWDNLITNAIKYNQPGGHIYITCMKDRDDVVITVQDTGIGLSEEAIRHVFDRFYRVDTTRKKDGTGLGLSIARDVVHLLSGSITVESELGKGTAFTVRLPLGS